MVAKCADCGTACYYRAKKCRECAQKDHKNRWDLQYKKLTTAYNEGKL